MPSRELLVKLRTGWDNQGWDAKLEYLEEILRRALVTEGPVLECGSGMTTLLLGELAGKRGVETWSLEHHDGWHRRVSKTINTKSGGGRVAATCPAGTTLSFGGVIAKPSPHKMTLVLSLHADTDTTWSVANTTAGTLTALAFCR